MDPRERLVDCDSANIEDIAECIQTFVFSRRGSYERDFGVRDIV